MQPYLKRLHQTLADAQPPRGEDPSLRAVSTVKDLAKAWKNEKLESLGYQTNADAALLKALREQRRAQEHGEGSVRVELGWHALIAFAHVLVLLEVEDVSLAARVAAMIDEVQYKERLLEVYRALNEL